jgi:hypothetical protein
VPASQVNFKLWRRAIAHDLASVARYGWRAPLWCERIWFDPPDCQDSYGSFKPSDSGMVAGGPWDQQTYRFERNPIAAVCLRRWRDGVDWEEAGAYELQLSRIKRYGSRSADQFHTLDDVIRRYERLDELFLTAKREGRLRPRSQTDGYTFREADGILIHIGRDCRPIFGHRGVHRFVIAKLLGFRDVPAQLGVVHPEALGKWRRQFRKGLLRNGRMAVSVSELATDGE